ncbi:MAG: hypothetical protein H0X33_13580 [Taibaiella sp.]|nr:hypothetical protein [Taibaiella sp.]
MKNFRFTASTAILCISIFCIVTYTACTKNDCGNTTCTNGGVCVKSICQCPTGYRDANCATAWTTEFLGSYVCTSTCASGTFTSVVKANSTNNQDTLVITNFGNSPGSNVVAGVDTSHHVFISSSNGGVTGHGTLANGVLTMSYVIVTSGGGGQTCTMTMTKQ